MTISIGNDPLPPQPGECCPDCTQPVLYPGRCPNCAAAMWRGEYDRRRVAKFVSEDRCVSCGGPRGDDGTAHRCRSCRSNHMAAKYQRLYGLSGEEALALRQQPCGVCGVVGRGMAKGLNDIDHDHATGRVRGALCAKHNKGLGLMDDDPATLRAAAEYLERHGSFGNKESAPWQPAS